MRQTAARPCVRSGCVSRALLGNLHVQEPIHAIHINPRGIDFFRKNAYRYYIGPTIDLSVASGMTAKNNHAMRCHAKNRGHSRVFWGVNKEVKLRGVSTKVVL